MNGGSTAHVVNWTRLGVLSGGAVLVALFLGWQSADVVVPPAAKSPRPAWDLPVHPEADTAKDLALLTQRKPWTGELGAAALAAAGADKKTATGWRLAGVVERSDGSFALIAVGKPGSAAYEYRAIGETLPDGSTLIELSHDTATTRSADAEGTQSIYKLFGGSETAPKPPTAGPAVPPDRRAELQPQSPVSPPTSGPAVPPNRRAELRPQSPVPPLSGRPLGRAHARPSSR